MLKAVPAPVDQPPVVIWQLLDGKPGHRSQVAGLNKALGRYRNIDSHEITVSSKAAGLANWALGRFPSEGLPTPDLILAAGHTTHTAALAARRAYGGKIVLMMRPSLPTSWFDLCLVPAHDNPKTADNVIVTQGVLNTVTPSQNHQQDKGFILLGGPSDAYDWDNLKIADQIWHVMQAQPDIEWTLTTSRRTPIDVLPLVTTIDGLNVIPHARTKPGWVNEQLALAGQTWVSEDSVSMIYEALTSGTQVGLLQVPRLREGRVSQGVDQLLQASSLCRFSEWQQQGFPADKGPALNEADRCAQQVVERCLAQ